MRERVEFQCRRCGSSILFETCGNCAGEGYFGHDCFEDSCCCLDPEDEICISCQGEGTIPICLSSPEWCEAHPLPGREQVQRSSEQTLRIMQETQANHDWWVKRAGELEQVLAALEARNRELESALERLIREHGMSYPMRRDALTAARAALKGAS